MLRRLPLLLVLLTACGPSAWWSARPVPGPDGGDDWYAITCQYKSSCYDGAKEWCPKGWIVMDGADMSGPVMASTYSGRGWSHTTVRQDQWMEMLIHCKRNLPPGEHQ